MIIFACSGPNALAIITENVEFASLQAQLVAMVVCLSLFTYLFGNLRHWHFPALALAILGAHPLWLVDPYSGDCGAGLRSYASAGSCIAVLLLASQIVWVVNGARRVKNGKRLAETGSRKVIDAE